LSNDSIGRQFFKEAQVYTFQVNALSSEDSVKLQAATVDELPELDSLYMQMDHDKQREVSRAAARQAQNAATDVEMKSDYAYHLNRLERVHALEAIGKFTLALSCIIFFFIGAPLGAIIRKGGLGVPVIVSVIVFLVFYLLDMTGMRMARDDNWTVWFGRSISTVVLAPLAAFFTYKANKDSTVFNLDAYRQVVMRVLGLRMKRNIMMKEVVIDDPQYSNDALALADISGAIERYSEEHRLLRWPSPIKVFFRPGDDHDIEQINGQLEEVIEDLGYTRDKVILHQLNNYPIMATHAHTRPFRRRWLNIMAGLLLPLGIFFYFRMLRFRFRLYKDLKAVGKTNEKIVERIKTLGYGK
jgi:lipopolysaccharide export system permease protein